MAQRKYTYSVEVREGDGPWTKLYGIGEESRDFCLGYFYGKRDGTTPCLAHRVVRSDGRVIEDFPESRSVGVGQVAGWPSADQYRRAAKVALDRADAIDRMNAERKRRCND